MAIMKCKMCGGDLNVTEGVSVVECEYCGSRQTIPSQDSEKKLTLFARADRLRRACEFDKAAGVYESIVAEFPQEAEAYWGLVLCRYGIEYVDDPATGKKVPTCHRSSFDSILEDADFDQACENADAIARRQYREEAKVIEDIRRGILEVSGKEEPYDIFICYKETDENGGRTIDSVIAQDVYDALTEKGYRVFFSRISLEDKLGTEYEPYIFAALNSAKVMLAFGTDYEYFNAVWVKNEWSRFLALMAAGQKKTLIPCYKNLDAYDMPKEFQRLQAQDMGKVGAIQDLLRGIEKIIPREKEIVEKTVVVQQSAAPAAPGVESFLKRGNMALEDGEWGKADEFFEQALNIDAECAQAYFGKALAARNCAKAEAFVVAEKAVPSPQQGERVDACPQDQAFINQMIKKYQSPLFLPDEKIRGICEQFDRTYESAASARRKELDQKRSALHSDKLLSRAVKYASGDLADQLAQYQTTILTAYEARLKEGESQDARTAKQVCQKYDEFKENTRRELESMYNGAQKKLAEGYAKGRGVWEHKISEEDGVEIMRALAESFRAAAGVFRSLGLYQDSEQQAKDCDKEAARIDQMADAKEKRLKAEADAAAVAEAERQRVIKEKQAREQAAKIKKFSIIGGAVAAVAIVIGIVVTQFIIPSGKYRDAEALLADGDTVGAAMAFGGAGVYQDAQARSMELWADALDYQTIAAGSWSTTAVLNDGTVTSAGHDVIFGGAYMSSEERSAIEDGWKEWTDIVSVAAGDERYGLHADGTVESTGDPLRWNNIVDIDADDHVVGLKNDGTVVASGDNTFGQCNVGSWNNIIAVAAGGSHTVGLKRDGTVVAAGSDDYGQRAVQDWTDIVAIAAGYGHTVGLRADGTVLAVGWNENGQCNVFGWSNIVAIAAGGSHTVGLKADGTVVATRWSGDHYSHQCEVGDWSDVVEISAGGSHTVGLKADGTVVAVGENDEDRQRGVSEWSGIKVPEITRE